MKIYRRIEPGEVIPENAEWLYADETGNTIDRGSEVYLAPIPLNPDPDAAGKAAYYQAWGSATSWENLAEGLKIEWRKLVNVTISTAVPQLVARTEELEKECAMLKRVAEGFASQMGGAYHE